MSQIYTNKNKWSYLSYTLYKNIQYIKNKIKQLIIFHFFDFDIDKLAWAIFVL
jgi:hypothetical protein